MALVDQPRRRHLVVVEISAVHPPRRGPQVRTAGLLANLGEKWEVESHSLTIQRTDLPAPPRCLRVTERWTDCRTRDPFLLLWSFLLGRSGYPPVFIDRLLALSPRRRLRRALARADVVLFHPPYHVGWLRAALPPGTPLVFDEHSIEAHMYQAGRSRWSRVVAQEVERSELMAFRVSDLVLATCEEDAEVARARGARRTAVVPNAVDLDRFRPADELRRRTIRQRLGLGDQGLAAIFVGSGHPPNVRAVEVLERQAEAYAAAGVRVILVGRCGIGRSRVDNVVHLGEVPDVALALQAADIALCPLVEGSGTSLKVVEFLAAGLAVISTSFGVRGLGVTAGVEAELCAVDEMPARVAQLAGDPERRQSLGAAARRLAEQRYGWSSSARVLADALDELVRSAR